MTIKSGSGCDRLEIMEFTVAGKKSGKTTRNVLAVTKARTGNKRIRVWPREFLRGKVLSKRHQWYRPEPICEPACRHLQ